MFNPFKRTNLGPPMDLRSIRTGRELLAQVEMHSIGIIPHAYWVMTLVFVAFDLVTLGVCAYFLVYVRPGKYWLFRLVECRQHYGEDRRDDDDEGDGGHEDREGEQQQRWGRGDQVEVAPADHHVLVRKDAEHAGTAMRVQEPRHLQERRRGRRGPKRGRHLVASALSAQLTFFSLWLLIDMVRRILLFLERCLLIRTPLVTVTFEHLANTVGLNIFYWDLVAFAHLFLHHVRPLYWNVGVLIFPVISFSFPFYYAVLGGVYEYRAQAYKRKVYDAVVAAGLDSPWPLSIIPDLTNAGFALASAYYVTGILAFIIVLFVLLLVVGFVVVAYFVVTRVLRDLEGQKTLRGAADSRSGGGGAVGAAPTFGSDSAWSSAAVADATPQGASSSFHLQPLCHSNDQRMQQQRWQRQQQPCKMPQGAGEHDAVKSMDASSKVMTTTTSVSLDGEVAPRAKSGYGIGRLSLPQSELKRFMVHCFISTCLGVSLPLSLGINLVPVVLHAYHDVLYDPQHLSRLHMLYTISYSVAVLIISTFGMANLYFAYRRKDPRLSQTIEVGDRGSGKVDGVDEQGKERLSRIVTRSSTQPPSPSSWPCESCAGRWDRCRGCTDAADAKERGEQRKTSGYPPSSSLRHAPSVSTVGTITYDDCRKADRTTLVYSPRPTSISTTKTTTRRFPDASTLHRLNSLSSAHAAAAAATAGAAPTHAPSSTTATCPSPAPAPTKTTRPSASQQLILDSLVSSRSLPIRDFVSHYGAAHPPPAPNFAFTPSSSSSSSSSSPPSSHSAHHAPPQPRHVGRPDGGCAVHAHRAETNVGDEATQGRRRWKPRRGAAGAAPSRPRERDDASPAPPVIIHLY
ncbi:uncharacterized protein PFL1_02884 [Pseudozyma flocculosa PF-1]|uniref:Uncharacterized protein n=2 Tax=Pseudozyma flocculosa TaxID=84751 RepID=A0A5C3F1R7_9BASI|nr:uncharacterized protein PFL1_02884 [Pseudozyma flocculosa PF-1]EPQ29664.1 hypothetical protein PFL1_02884 [Pseudozyma flocculosa PF-1]SPO38232.1 uncharacterized protein PSFLO_03709 [Pseudozyma flocculosa]